SYTHSSSYLFQPILPHSSSPTLFPYTTLFRSFSHESGRIDIRASFDDAGDLVLEVEDYGIGMAENEITRALEPFGQARPAVTKTHGGTGLGLPIAKGLTEAHGGKLFVESTPREGTRVRILLPQQANSPDAA